MKIEKFTYCQNKGTKFEWKIENCTLNPKFNLIVGKNAVGKTRFINSITALARTISHNILPPFSSQWEVSFYDKEETIKYSLEIEELKIINETFQKDERKLLYRDKNSKGKIYAEEIKKEMSFQIKENEIAVLKKNDKIQHPYLETLLNWANNIFFYKFGDNTKQHNINIPPNNFANDNSLIGYSELSLLIKKGEERDKRFKENILNDMKEIGFEIEDIEIDNIEDNTFVFPPSKIKIIYLKEKGINTRIPQKEISQGMFRTLSLISYLNYLILDNQENKKTRCVLIDDIGEGLDYDRTTKLIKLLLNKFTNENFQFIMTTNNKFVMNAISLEYWILLDREAHKLKIYNKHSTPEIFEEFEFTGLNNFDLLSTEFYKD